MTQELSDSIKQILAFAAPDSGLANAINQLVELVAEMRDTIKYLEPELFEDGDNFTLERAAAQKADALLKGLKEGV
jgi:hypothetical protein